MISIKDTYFYQQALINEFNYSFGNLYVFNGFVVSEINQGEVMNKEKAEVMADDIPFFRSTKGKHTVFISNRIHSYSVVATDWISFFKEGYSLKSYYIVSKAKTKPLNFAIEQLFFKNRIKHFTNLYAAINYEKQCVLENTPNYPLNLKY